MPPAARITDMHVCPMFTGPVPHVGGPILPPGAPTVLIGGLPAATVGDMAVCTGPPDSIVQGSATVLIGGKPAARMGDSTAHGGTIILGCVTVIIGGQTLTSESAGGVAGVDGLLQVNVRMPPGLTPGTSVPVVVSAGGVASQGGVTLIAGR